MLFENKVKNFAVIGNPVDHSFSPIIHKEFAKQLNLEIQYNKIEAKLDLFESTVSNFFLNNGYGLNITTPFKMRAYFLPDTIISERAKAAGSVNTLWKNHNKIYGCNTDGIGLLKDLKNLEIWRKDIDILIIGAGGAVRGVLGKILEETTGSIHIVNRSVEKVMELIKKIHNPKLTGGDFSTAIKENGWPLVINATTASLEKKALVLPKNLYSPGGVAYDMMYGANETEFMLQARFDGATRVFDGLGMLVHQAAESFRIWHKKKPLTFPILEKLRTFMKNSKNLL